MYLSNLRVPKYFFGLLWILALVGSARAASSTDDAVLFLAPDRAEDAPQSAPRREAAVTRSRRVRINWQSLAPSTSPPGSETLPPIVLNLFDDKIARALPTRRVSRTANSFIWHGQIEGLKHGQVTLAVEGGVMAGSIEMDRQFFQIRHAGGEDYLIREIDPRRFPREGNPRPVSLPRSARDGVPAKAADSSTLIDLMVVYTPAARVEEGGTAAMNALITLAIAETNTALSRSNVNARLRLVHRQEIAYTESGDFDIDLDRITNQNDNFMDSVQTLRDAYGADVVTLMAADNPDLCGLAWLMTTESNSFENLAFNVVARTCATGPLYTFGHELGHVMGLQHDRVDESSNGVFAYSHGYVNPAQGFRTMLGVQSSCSGCTRIQNYANPSVLHNGVPTGVSQSSPQSADAASSLNAVIDTVANWRQSVLALPAVDFDGDGKSDVGIYRDGVWSIIRSLDSGNTVFGLGGPTWTPVPADFDGDGKADIAAYLNGAWIIQRSSDNTTVVVGHGGPGYVPLPGDYDGDGKADVATYLDGIWSIKRSSDNGITTVGHGGPGFTPVPADYDGDEKIDVAVYLNGTWVIKRSSDGGTTVAGHGGPTFTPVPADFDGDGKADVAVYVNGTWSIKRSSDGGNTIVGHGGPTWTPVPADFDGDGRVDITVYLNGAWSIIQSVDSSIAVVGHGGAPTDVPLN